MTLERHKSHLIPEVQYSLDGTLFVTDVGGTFPLRGKSSKRSDVREHDFGDAISPPTFRSFDFRREENKRRYKQRRSPSRDGTSTLSNNTSSLGRRLRRSKRKSGLEFLKKEKYFPKENGSMSSRSSGSRFHSGPPRMTPEFADSIRRKSHRGSKESGKGSLKRTNKDIDTDPYSYRLSNSSLQEKARYRKIHDERLPYLLFLIDGILLMVTGVVRIILSFWHEYFSSIIAGFLLLILGIIGAKHQGMYLAKGISGAYIVFALLNGLVMVGASGLVLYVFMPMVLMVSEDIDPAVIIRDVTFTNMDKTLASVNISPLTMIWSSLALDIGTLIFLFLGFFTMTAAMIAISNHWDACYDTTADCDHRGNPRLFNPIEQVIVGVASAFVGLVYMAAEAGFVHVNHAHYYAPLWSSAMVIISGCISLCYGKRPDRLAMGTFACFVEILAFLTCSAATVLTTLGLVNDVNDIQELTDQSGFTYNQLLAMAVLGGAFDLMLTVDVIFTVGTLFRQFRQVCCQNCCALQN